MCKEGQRFAKLFGNNDGGRPVSAPSLTRPKYCFSVFEVDAGAGELRRNGVRLRIQDQPFQVLLKLLAQPSQIVTREELKAALWPSDTFVDFDNGLNMAVKRLREALADDADRPVFIETVPRKGYRFICPVDKPNSAVTAASANVPFGRPRAQAWGRLAGVMLLVLLSAIGIWRLVRNHAEASLPPMEIVPLVGLPGLESEPAFSLDGNQVAFSIQGPENPGIYTTVVGGEKSLRLTRSAGDCCPRWSPDGRQVAFLRATDDGVVIHVIPTLGGTEHRLYSGPSGFFEFYRSLDWSPDGKVLAFTESHADKTHSWITLLSLADLTTRRLTSPSDQELDYGPAFSPDSSTVAFVRGIVSGGVSDLYVMSSAGGAPKRLTVDNAWIFGAPTWTPDGRDIVFSSMRGGLLSLWRVSASGGTPRPVTGVGEMATSPSIARKGEQLVYQHVVREDNISRIDLKDETHREGQLTKVTSEKGRKLRPRFSPNGKRIAFESYRLGYSDIWACDSDGANCGQLTSLHGVAGATSWSPDGRYIAFEFRPKEHSEVYLLDVHGGMPQLLDTFPGADNGGPNWSRDGRWIYFYSDRGGGPLQIWKVQLRGGDPVRVTRNGGVFAAESADGRFLYYAKANVPGIWRMPLEGGEETRILDQPYTDFAWWNWALARNGIYFLNFETKPDVTLAYFEFATRKNIPICTLTTPPGLGVSVSTDGKSILLVQRELAQSNIMLVKNFH